MPYLERRIHKLITDLKSGATTILPEVASKLAPELERVRYLEGGKIDLGSCSPSLRSFARAYHIAQQGLGVDSVSETTQEPVVDSDSINSLNRSLFELYDEVFEAGTGTPPDRFTRDGEDFNAAMLRQKDRILSDKNHARRLSEGFHAASERLRTHYAESGVVRLNAAAQAAGLKLVLGGAQGFTATSLRASRSMLLYCDSLLIPDPVHRWFEMDPVHEKSPIMSMLREIYHLSKLKPLTRADLPGTPIIVFPSLEKRMEADDEQTKDGIELLALSVFSWLLDGRFEDISEVLDFARGKPALFLDAVAEKDAFTPMGAEIDGDLPAKVASQRSQFSALRSPAFAEAAEKMTDAEVVWLSIMERLGPQFHVMVNAESLGASPLFALPVHWKYFRMCQRAGAASMNTSGEVTKGTMRLVEQLVAQKSSWLGNVSIDNLVELRREMANREFRARLRVLTDQLNEESGTDMNKALANVSLELTSLLKDHDREVKKIDEEFRNRHGKTLVSLLLTAGASFLPSIPPLAPAFATGAVIKLANDAIDELARRNRIKKSMLGVLAAAHKQTEDSQK